MNAVVIVAGGAGSRMGSGIPKQYLDLAGKPAILHTLERFLEYDPGIRITVVIAEAHREYWERIVRNESSLESVDVAPGGKTRYQSVLNGLQQVEDGWIVGIHDAVRPFVSLETLERCYTMADKSGSAIPVLEMEETVRFIKSSGRSEHMDRSRLKRVQTPQVFRSELIREAYDKTRDTDYTDDASVFEAVHGPVNLVEGNRENIKITSPIDMQLAAIMMANGQ
jgi:2-C-methyl-D-erythritol 4-phosphate cytidylyltransferase